MPPQHRWCSSAIHRTLACPLVSATNRRFTARSCHGRPPQRPSAATATCRNRRRLGCLRRRLSKSPLAPMRTRSAPAGRPLHEGVARMWRCSHVIGHVNHLLRELLDVLLYLRELGLVHLLPLHLADRIERRERQHRGLRGTEGEARAQPARQGPKSTTAGVDVLPSLASRARRSLRPLPRSSEPAGQLASMARPCAHE